MNIDDDTGPYTERQKQVLRDAYPHLVRPAPLVKGGQGRSADDVRGDAETVATILALALIVAVAATVVWCCP